MKFSRAVFLGSGIYGLGVLLPQYSLEPPDLAHPEHFYGFVGVAAAWQIAFLVIGSDPLRFRPIMLVAVVEKASFGSGALLLFERGRVGEVVLGFGLLDLVLGASFFTAWWRLRPRKE